MYYTEISAKDGTNIQQLFENMSKFLYVKNKDKINTMEERTGSVLAG